MRRLSIFLILAALFSMGDSCGQEPTTSSSETLTPSRRRSLWGAEKIYLVYGSQDEASRAAYTQWAEALPTQSRRRVLVPVADASADPDSLRKYPVILVGTPQSNTWIAQWQDQLPISFHEGHFQLFDKRFAQADAICQLAYLPHPLTPALPLMVVSGQDDVQILSHLESALGRGRGGLPIGRWGYEVICEKKRVWMGQLDYDGKPQEDLSWFFPLELEPVHEAGAFRIYDHEQVWTSKVQAALLDQMEAINGQLDRLFPGTQAADSLVIHLYREVETMGLRAGSMSQTWWNEDTKELHVLVHPLFKNIGHEDLAKSLILGRVGTSKRHMLLEGLASLLTPQWQRLGAAAWAARLGKAGQLLSLDDLTDKNVYEQSSPMIRKASAACFVSLLLKADTAGFMATYQGEMTEAYAVNMFRYTKELLHYDQIAQAKPLYTGDIPYFRGMTLAHEGYQGYNGYGSSQAAKSLDRLQAMDVNWIALVPYSGTREPQKPTPYRFQGLGTGGENDMSLAYSFYHANERGMHTLLKPQIWIPGTWPGAVEMKNQEDWDAFFKYYGHWIAHYAMVAEIYQMDMLCAGVEFLKATVKQPEAWRNLIGQLRQLYSGPITYAANWGEEIEKLAFADALDVIGVNCYYPLSKSARAGEAELRKGFAQTLDKIRDLGQKFGKPIAFTEIGFRSIPQPWVQPHAEAPDRQSYSGPDQALCYKIVSEALAAEGDWFVGTVWWKWPTYLAYSSENLQSFTPAGKEAEKILGETYAKLARKSSKD
ncbi:MAG: hypothetical protein AAFR61_09355 [Bacteroidota bacterium]